MGVLTTGKSSSADVAATYSGRYVLTSSTSVNASFMARLFDHQWDPPRLFGTPGSFMLRPDLHDDLNLGRVDGGRMVVNFLDRIGFSTGSSLLIYPDSFLNGVMRIGGVEHGVAVVWSESGPGPVVLLDTNPQKLTELGSVPALSSKTWNGPALAGKYLLVRNDHEAVCYEVSLAK